MRSTTKPNEISARIPSDGQLSGLSGELFVAAELLRRGHQVAITMGTAKSVDLFVQNRAGETFSVQVKTLRRPNSFIISPERVAKGRVYAFVILNDVDNPPTFFFISGRELLDQKDRFWTHPGEKLAGFGAGVLKAYRDAWGIFEEHG